jgi:hypothetical protein
MLKKQKINLGSLLKHGHSLWDRDYDPDSAFCTEEMQETEGLPQVMFAGVKWL